MRHHASVHHRLLHSSAPFHLFSLSCCAFESLLGRISLDLFNCALSSLRQSDFSLYLFILLRRQLRQMDI
uniref:DUF4139 domain-containing protein n=1 Tax=Parascaris univalens TaxID=6257 RepID=A0A915BRU8_PARUN